MKSFKELRLTEARQMKDPKKDCMVQKGGKTIVIDKSKEKEYLKKGWSLAESTEVLEEKFVVKYAKNKRGPIYQTKFSTQPEAEKFLAQKKKEGMNGIVSKAGQHTSMQKMKDLQKESVELEEAVDFEKMSNELLKKKKLGIEFEKAAAFARVMFMNSSLSVQDKAMKGLLTLIKGIDDLTVKTTLIKILKDNGFKVKGGRVMREEVELDEALQSVTKIKFDYKDTMPKDPKPSDVGGLKQDWNNDRTAVRSAVKPLGGLVTDSEAPSRTNKFVGTLSVGTRGDASKLSNSAIQKAVKSKGAEIQNNQFMSESVDLEEGKMKEFHDYIDQGKSAQWIAKKMGLDMRTVKELMADMKESVELDEQNTIELAKDIVKTKSAKKGLDMQTANLIVQVYNKVNDVNKKKMEKMNPKQLGHAVWKMTGKN